MTSYKNLKIKGAEELVSTPCETEAEKRENIARAIKIYRDLCMSKSLNVDDKVEIFVSFYNKIMEDAIDMLARWRDSIPFTRGPELQELTKLLVTLSMHSSIGSIDRLYTAVNLYNVGMITVCYGCFSSIATDKSALVEHRVDAARYLYASGDETFKRISQDTLLEVIEMMALPSLYRFTIIAGFSRKTGIASLLNCSKLNIDYDEDFIYTLYREFFDEKRNGVRELLLAGQFILQLDTIDDEEKVIIGTELITIAENADLEENVRADAADIVLREGIGEQKIRARHIIAELGFNVGGVRNLLDKTRTVYANSQNVHDETIAKYVETFIERIVTDANIKVRPYHEVHQEISELIRGDTLLNPAKRHAAFKALNRVSVDSAKFTKHRASISEIFVHIWIRVQAYDDIIREELQKRLIDELIDMSDTCSSGHVARFVNVLSIYDGSIRIEWDDQIKANMAGRMNAKIRDCEDPNTRASVSLGMLEGADEEDREVYLTFIKDNLNELKDELYKEFVGEGYISNDIFEKAFEEGRKTWMA